jgi:hypothetical protein
MPLTVPTRTKIGVTTVRLVESATDSDPHIETPIYQLCNQLLWHSSSTCTTGSSRRWYTALHGHTKPVSHGQRKAVCRLDDMPGDEGEREVSVQESQDVSRLNSSHLLPQTCSAHRIERKKARRAALRHNTIIPCTSRQPLGSLPGSGIECDVLIRREFLRALHARRLEFSSIRSPKSGTRSHGHRKIDHV